MLLVCDSQERLSESHCTFAEQYMKNPTGYMLHGGMVCSGCDINHASVKDVDGKCLSKDCRRGAWVSISIAMCNKHRV